MANSILNRIATATRYIDLDGPNMRKCFAGLTKERRARRNSKTLRDGTICYLPAVPTFVDSQVPQVLTIQPMLEHTHETEVWLFKESQEEEILKSDLGDTVRNT